MMEKVKSGIHSGWKTRRKLEPSFPEKFFMRVLNNNGISYEYEHPCGKYFIDFAIHDKKIALEIDGKQHNEEGRKKSDSNKDEFLKSRGWIVYRIKWRSIHNKSGKEYIEGEIDKFLKTISAISSAW